VYRLFIKDDNGDRAERETAEFKKNKKTVNGEPMPTNFKRSSLSIGTQASKQEAEEDQQ